MNTTERFDKYVNENEPEHGWGSWDEAWEAWLAHEQSEAQKRREVES